MKKLLLILSFHFLSAETFDVPASIRQLLVVWVNEVSQNQSTLQAYERSQSHTPWKAVFKPIAVTLGRNGLGLGLGMHDEAFDPYHLLTLKVEGDGKSPAGIFRLSKIFGYAQKSPNNHMPYLELTKKIHCVDDPQSPYYNKIIKATKGYQSFEKMRRDDDLYQWGIVVDHNKNGLSKRGSCIFIHIARKDRAPTAGCTAMGKKDLVKIIQWLDQTKDPALLQYLKDR